MPTCLPYLRYSGYGEEEKKKEIKREKKNAKLPVKVAKSGIFILLGRWMSGCLAIVRVYSFCPTREKSGRQIQMRRVEVLLCSPQPWSFPTRLPTLVITHPKHPRGRQTRSLAQATPTSHNPPCMHTETFSQTVPSNSSFSIRPECFGVTESQHSNFSSHTVILPPLLSFNVSYPLFRILVLASPWQGCCRYQKSSLSQTRQFIMLHSLDSDEVNHKLALTVAFTAALKSDSGPGDLLSYSLHASSSDTQTKVSPVSTTPMAPRFRGSNLVIQDCSPEKSHFDPPTPKHKAIARRLKSRLSTWRLVPKLPKRRTFANFAALGNGEGHDKALKKQGLSRSITIGHFSNLARIRRHKSPPSISSDDTKLDNSPTKLSSTAEQNDEADPFTEENVLDTSLDALLQLLPDGYSTPRRRDSVQRQSALPRGLDISKTTIARSSLLKPETFPSLPSRPQPYATHSISPTRMLKTAIPQRTSSKATGGISPRVSSEKIQYKKHPSPSKNTLKSLKLCCQDAKSHPRTAFSFRKSSTVQDFSAGIYGLYEATTVSQKRRSTPSRKAKLIQLRGKSSKSATTWTAATGVAGSTAEKVKGTSESTLAITPPHNNVAVPPSGYYRDPDVSDTAQLGRTLRFRSVNLRESSRPPPPRYTLPKPETSIRSQHAPSSFSPSMHPIRIFVDKESTIPDFSEKKKHPSPTKEEWEILGGHWRHEMDRLGLRVCGFAPAPVQLDSIEHPVTVKNQHNVR